jgi:hypothetical protein
MQLFSKREKINRDTFNADFNQNFYDGTKSFKTSTRSLEQIGKDLNVVSLTTNRIIDNTQTDPYIRIDNRQLENYFVNNKPDSNRPIVNTEYNVVTQRQEPLELVTPVLFRSVTDKSGTQFAANRSSLRETELKSNLQNTRSVMPYAETVYD